MWPFDQSNQAVYQQYAQAYDAGSFNGLDHRQALGHIQQFMQGAPVDMQQQLYQQHFSQMPYEQRLVLAQQMPPQYAMDPNDPWSMTQGFLRMGQEQPHLLQQVFSHPLLLGGAVGLAGLIARHMLNRHQENAYDNQSYGYNPGYQNAGYQNPGLQNAGYQDGYLQQELAQEQQEVQELRSELREEERERHHHHHRQEW